MKISPYIPDKRLIFLIVTMKKFATSAAITMKKSPNAYTNANINEQSWSFKLF